jgi:3'-5' exoribonuclease
VVLLVRSVETRAKRDGGEYLKLTLADRSGQVTACIWDDVAEVAPLCRAATPLRVVGRFSRHPRYGPQVNVRALRQPAPGSFQLADLLDGPPRSADQMESDLRELVATIQQPHLRALLDRLLGDGSPTWPLFRDAPAAKHFHQAYRTACSSTACRSRRASARSARRSRASTARSR